MWCLESILNFFSEQILKTKFSYEITKTMSLNTMDNETLN